MRVSHSELLPTSSDGIVASSKDVERILLHCFSSLVIHQFLSGSIEVFLHVRCVLHQKFDKMFLSKCLSSSDGIGASSKDVERILLHCLSRLVIHYFLSGLTEVFLHMRCIPHQKFDKMFLSKCVCVWSCILFVSIAWHPVMLCMQLFGQRDMNRKQGFHFLWCSATAMLDPQLSWGDLDRLRESNQHPREAYESWREKANQYTL